jgi:cytochrome P450
MGANVPGPNAVAQTGSQFPNTGPIDRLVKSAVLAWNMLTYRAICFFLCYLLPAKLLFALLRRIRPLSLFFGTLIVTRADDVREVLGRFDDFQLGQFIETGMPWGPFIMTIDWREQHAIERRLLESVVNTAADKERIGAIVTNECQVRTDAFKALGQIDVVAHLAEPVVVRISAEYFGIPPISGSIHRMADAMADLAGILMANPPVGSQPWIDSRRSIADVTTELLAQLSVRKTAVAQGKLASFDDLLGRLAALLGLPDHPLWFDEDWIRRYMTGLVAAGGSTIVRAVAHTVDQLLAHPDGLRQAQKLAARLDADPSNRDLMEELRLVLYEALRFRPMLPLLIRDCPRDTALANGTTRARLVPGGTRVLASPLAAMFDPEPVPAPWHFHVGRSPDEYLHFGYGDRHCFGRYIADMAMMEVLRAVLRLPELARAAGSKGRINYQGPAPRSLVVTFRAQDRAGEP